MNICFGTMGVTVSFFECSAGMKSGTVYGGNTIYVEILLKKNTAPAERKKVTSQLHTASRTLGLFFW